MKISVCIPMYNESAVIESTAKTLWQYMNDKFGNGNFEIIFSDDGSRDNCSELVKALELPDVKVIRYEQNRGKGCAVRTAFLKADGDIVMFTDADLAYGTDVIRRVYDALSADADAQVLIGSRNISKDGYESYSFVRKVASKMYIKILCITGGFKLSDSQCGCKAFKQGAVKSIFNRCEVDGFAFDFEAILWANKLGLKIIELPVKVINSGDSKVNIIKDTFKMLKDLRKMKKRIKKAQI